MTSVAAAESNVHVWGVDGSSDDLDVPLAELFKDTDFRTKHKLGSLNSINIARVVSCVHHLALYAYLAASFSLLR